MIKMPCEIAIWKTLPSIRRELAIYLSRERKIDRKRVAKLIGVTEPALCQYLKNKRGSIRFNDKQKEAIRKAGDELISEKKSKHAFMEQICSLCKTVRSHCRIIKGGCV